MGRATKKVLARVPGELPTCQFCGLTGLHWKQLPHTKQWRLYTQNNALHICGGGANAQRRFAASKDAENHPYYVI